MKHLSLLALTALSLAFTPSAKADVTAPAWGCTIDANLQGFEKGFIVVVKILEGEGVMSCRSASNDVIRQFPIKITIKGGGVGLGWSEVRNQKFLTGSIGLSQPGAIYGKYQGQINADVTVIDRNGTAGFGLEFSKGGVGVKGVLSGGDANGAFAGITLVGVTITPMN